MVNSGRDWLGTYKQVTTNELGAGYRDGGSRLRVIPQCPLCLCGENQRYETRRVFRFMKSIRMNCPRVMVLVK